jgi:hypothetical protein
MRKLEALKVGVVQREEKRKKNMFCELESLFFFLLFFIIHFHLHFKDDF